MNLSAQKRDILGKRVKSLRQKGLIPAELYGRGFSNIHLAIRAEDFLRVFREAGESSLVKLIMESSGDDKGVDVLINDISRDPLTDEILNVDFYRVRMDEKITARIPVRFTGEAPAVKEKNGVLVKAVQEVEVESLPGDLPKQIDVDLGSLADIGSTIAVEDLKIPRGVKILIDPETVVVTVTEMAKEEEMVKPVSVEEVQVEGEEKGKRKEEMGAEGETPEKKPEKKEAGRAGRS